MEQPAALEKFAKGPDFFGVRARIPIPRGAFLVSVAGPVAAERSRYSLQVGPGRHVDSRGVRGIDDFLNHGCFANAFVVFPALEVRAARDIAAGEEVLLNYCATEEELYEPFACACGSPRCYGAVRGFRFLDRRQQEALRETASPWLKEKYRL